MPTSFISPLLLPHPRNIQPTSLNTVKNFCPSALYVLHRTYKTSNQYNLTKGETFFSFVVQPTTKITQHRKTETLSFDSECTTSYNIQPTLIWGKLCLFFLSAASTTHNIKQTSFNILFFSLSNYCRLISQSRSLFPSASLPHPTDT